MALIPCTELRFHHWDENPKIPEYKIGIERISITHCGTDEQPPDNILPLTFRNRFRLEIDNVNIFSCLAEKTYNLYGIKITDALVMKLLILTNLEFDIDFNIKKIGTPVEFAILPYRDNKEFVEDVKDVSQKLISIQSKQ